VSKIAAGGGRRQRTVTVTAPAVTAIAPVVGGLRSDPFIPRISNLILRDLSG
jgi:hypothetical protein